MCPTSCSRHCSTQGYRQQRSLHWHVARVGGTRPRALPGQCTPAQSTRQKSITQAADQANLTLATSALPSQSTALNVWAEHAPPRLDSEAVTKLIEKFKQNYPSEHLDSDTRPSIRLLSLVHQWLRPRGTIKWVPWQLRMSEKTYQELIWARAARTLRTEAQLISNALFDETPEVSVAPGGINPAWLMKTQVVFSNAIAICGGAHLRMLRAFDKRIFDLATQSLAPESGLRAVHTQELLQADRKIWAELACSSQKAGPWTRHCMSSRR